VVDEVIYSPVGYGTHMYVSHDKNIRSLYAHLMNVKVEPGQNVAKGEALAEIGMTGLSTGPHVHFELSVEGRRVNPIYYIADAIEDYQELLALRN
jgi:murein DD-endopeptidase MepM/ murein hydrolase activator NlpD